MNPDPQVTQLEEALIHQAETLAREQIQNAEAARARILAESEKRLKLAEEREILAAKVEAERQLRRQVQAAETQLAAELDRLRWALTQAALTEVKQAFQRRMADEAAYSALLEQWLTAAIASLPPGDLVAEVQAGDETFLAPRWDVLVARIAPARKITLSRYNEPSLGGIRVRTSDNRARYEQTFEARWARLADELARVAMERLFASAPDLGTLVHG